MADLPLMKGTKHVGTFFCLRPATQSTYRVLLEAVTNNDCEKFVIVEGNDVIHNSCKLRADRVL
jgi:hypothetical protein